MRKDRLMVGEANVDPLTKGAKGPQELFKRFSREANGFPVDAAIGAAGNIILNAIRQEYPKQKDADEAITRLIEKLRQSLSDHYYGTGSRRSIFPFHQDVVLAPDFMEYAKGFRKKD